MVKVLKMMGIIILSIILLGLGGTYVFLSQKKASVLKTAGLVTELFDGQERTMDQFIRHGRAVSVGGGSCLIVTSLIIKNLETKESTQYIVVLEEDSSSYSNGKVVAYGRYEKIDRQIVDKEVLEQEQVTPIKYVDGHIIGPDGNEPEELKQFGFYFEVEDPLLLSDISEVTYNRVSAVPSYWIDGKLDESKSKQYFNQNIDYFNQKGITSFDDFHVVTTLLDSPAKASILTFENTISNGLFQIEISEGVSSRYTSNTSTYKDEFYSAQQVMV